MSLFTALLIALQVATESGRSNRHSRRHPSSDALWSTYGYNRENQQTSPSQINKRHLKKNMNNVNVCSYQPPDMEELTFSIYFGYIAVDNDNNGYATDSSGYIYKFDLDTCETIWNVNIAEILGYSGEGQVISRNAITLYDNYVLIGTPNGRHLDGLQFLYPLNETCYAIAFNQADGSFEYKINLNFIDLDNDAINDISNMQNIGCHSHGFVVDKDNKFAYGGFASAANFAAIPNPLHAFQGRVYKINLQTRQIEDVFFTLPDNNGQTQDRYTNLRQPIFGASSWNFPALIDDYLVFGAANAYSYPDRIGDCLLNSEDDTSLIPDNNYPYNQCGDDKSDNAFWRCLEDDAYIDSVMALNVNDFSIKSVTRTMGVDAWSLDCSLLPEESHTDCPIVGGPDTDVTGIATYKTRKGDIVAITTTKGGQFIAVNIENGKVLISKQIGLSSWINPVTGSAVDPKTEIAISMNTGRMSGRYQLPNGDIICNTGTMTAIDLKTGKSIWIFVVPYGRIVSRDGEDVCSDDDDELPDDAEQGRCTIDPKGNRFIDDSKVNVIIPTEMSDQLPINSIDRAQIRGQATISNGFVYIPTLTGDVYVLELKTGKFVTRFECPDVGAKDENGDYIYNRAGVQGGITVIKKRIIFYCGGEADVNRIQSINFDY